MEQVLLVVQVIIAVALIIMVLIQRSDSDGFGLGGGGGNGLISGRGQANLMTRTTAILAALFIINSLALSVIAARSHESSIVETIEKQQNSKDAAPAVPVAGEKKADKKIVKDEKKADEETTAPSVPAADADAKPAVKVKPAKKAVDESSQPAADGENSDINN
jgi:preprotein translocase subunit SecG